MSNVENKERVILNQNNWLNGVGRGNDVRDVREGGGGGCQRDKGV